MYMKISKRKIHLGPIGQNAYVRWKVFKVKIVVGIVAVSAISSIVISSIVIALAAILVIALAAILVIALAAILRRFSRVTSPS
jgi:hypothetical protein